MVRWSGPTTGVLQHVLVMSGQLCDGCYCYVYVGCKPYRRPAHGCSCHTAPVISVSKPVTNFASKQGSVEISLTHVQVCDLCRTCMCPWVPMQNGLSSGPPLHAQPTCMSCKGHCSRPRHMYLSTSSRWCLARGQKQSSCSLH